MNIELSLQDFSFLTALLLVGAYIVIDGLYAYYTIQIAKRKALNAASTSAVMHFLLAIGVLNYVHNFLYIIPLAIGSWIGTYIVVKSHHNREISVSNHINLES